MVIIGNDKVCHMTKVAVLGSTGMLGSTLTSVLENQIETVYEFNRSGIFNIIV